MTRRAEAEATVTHCSERKRGSLKYVHPIEFDARVEDTIRAIRADMIRACAIPEGLLKDLPKYPSISEFLEQMRVWCRS